jgi:hypothetical protein
MVPVCSSWSWSGCSTARERIADIVILFATLEDGREIRRLIGAEDFFGIPYRMYNR